MLQAVPNNVGTYYERKGMKNQQQLLDWETKSQAEHD